MMEEVINIECIDLDVEDFTGHEEACINSNIHSWVQPDGYVNNNSSYVTYNDSLEYAPNHSMAPHNGYASPVPLSHHPVTTLHEEIQFGAGGSGGSGRVTPAQRCQRVVAEQPTVGDAPDNGPTIQPKPPSSLKPRSSRTRRSLRKAANLLLNHSRQSLSDTEGKAGKVMTPTPPTQSSSSHAMYSPTDASPVGGDGKAPSIRDRLQKNRARMGELLRSPSFSKWRRGSKENIDVKDASNTDSSPVQNGTIQGYTPNRRYRSAENLHTPSYTSYESPDPYLDSRTDQSYHDSSDGTSALSVESTPLGYGSGHQSRRHSSGQAYQRSRSTDRMNHRGYHTADSDTDSSYSRHDGTNGDLHSRYNSKRPLPSSFRLLSKGGRDGPLRTTPKGHSGPMKADHSIQPFTKEKRSPDGSPRDMWGEQGARPKHYSSTDSLETEQVTHIVFQDTPIRSEPSDKNSSSSRPTTPSALRKSSRPPSPSRSVRFDDDTDGSYDSDRRDRRPQSRSRRSESPDVRSSRQNNGTSNEMPVYAKVDKSQRIRTSHDQVDDCMSQHDVWTNSGEREGPYARVDDGRISHSTRSRTNNADYEEVDFRPRSDETIRTRPQSLRTSMKDRDHGSEHSSRTGSSKDFRTSTPSTAGKRDASSSRRAVANRHESPSRSQLMVNNRGRSQSRESLASQGNPCVIEGDNGIEHLGSSRLDNFDFPSDYDSYKKLSGSQLSILSRSSISEKVEKTKKKLRRALSLDKLSSPSSKESYSLDKPKLKKSPSLRSLTGLLKKKDKDVDSGFSSDGMYSKRRAASMLGLETSTNGSYSRPQRTSEETDVTMPTHGRKIGRLLSIKPDGTQVIQLVKPPNGPFGFYIAKGTSGSGKDGIFVTRLGDGHPAKILAGLLQVGDEILQINGQDVHSKKLDDVYDLMMDNNTLRLCVRPLDVRS